MSERLEKTMELLTRARTEVARVIIGQNDVIDQAFIAFLSGQHALIEGVPGIGKTLLVRTLAAVLGCEFARIQFTPDLMPSDITGTNVFNMKLNEFTLMKGPVFTTFLLADEINRAPAKTQSALLQAMQERLVTIDRETYELSPNFTVFATQNPIEFEGTYPLPEAQKDRFMLKIVMDFPLQEEERLLARRTINFDEPERMLTRGGISAILSEHDLPVMRESMIDVAIREELIDYLVTIVRKTRRHSSVMVGASPRAMQAFIRAVRAQALLSGRDFVTPDDIKAVSIPVLEHRIVMRPEFEIEGLTIREIVEDILKETPVPR